MHVAVKFLYSLQELLAQITCPPPGFDSANFFDLLSYIDGPWYVQKQVSSVPLLARAL